MAAAGAVRLTELLLGIHNHLAEAKDCHAKRWQWGTIVSVQRADDDCNDLAALLLPAIAVVLEMEEEPRPVPGDYRPCPDAAELALVAAHDDFLRSFPDDDPPF